MSGIPTLPESDSVTWRINVGRAGILRYAPLPTNLRTAVLEPLKTHPGETPDELAVQDRLTELVTNRTPILS